MALTLATPTVAPKRIDWWQSGIMALLLVLLTAFIVYPVLRVLSIALSDDSGSFTLIHFGNFFRRPLFREALSDAPRTTRERQLSWHLILPPCSTSHR